MKDERTKSIADKNNSRNLEFQVGPSKSKNLKSIASTPVPALNNQKESKLVKNN